MLLLLFNINVEETINFCFTLMGRKTESFSNYMKFGPTQPKDKSVTEHTLLLEQNSDFFFLIGHYFQNSCHRCLYFRSGGCKCKHHFSFFFTSFVLLTVLYRRYPLDPFFFQRRNIHVKPFNNLSLLIFLA